MIIGTASATVSKRHDASPIAEHTDPFVFSAALNAGVASRHIRFGSICQCCCRGDEQDSES